MKLIEQAEYKNTKSGYQTHFHNGYEMILVKNGTAKITINKKTYDCKPGYLTFISNFEEHSVEASNVTYSRYYAVFNQQQTDREINDPELLSFFKTRPENFVHFIDVYEKIGVFEDLFLRLLEENDSENLFLTEMSICIIKQILILSLRVLAEEGKSKKPAEFEIYEVQRFLDENFSKKILISEVAKKFYFNEFYLSHRFKQVCGLSPKQYLKLCRLSAAKKLLLTTSLPACKIAVRCGFFDANNFSKAFKEEFSVTPGEYRQKNTAVD